MLGRERELWQIVQDNLQEKWTRAQSAVASTKVVCDGPDDQRAEDMKAATA